MPVIFQIHTEIPKEMEGYLKHVTTSEEPVTDDGRFDLTAYCRCQSQAAAGTVCPVCQMPLYTAEVPANQNSGTLQHLSSRGHFVHLIHPDLDLNSSPPERNCKACTICQIVFTPDIDIAILTSALLLWHKSTLLIFQIKVLNPIKYLIIT